MKVTHTDANIILTDEADAAVAVSSARTVRSGADIGKSR